MKLIIAGDLVPTNVNIDAFKRGDINLLIDERLRKIWNSVDIRIFNLEVPLFNGENPILKCGPNLMAPESTINGIKSLKPTLLTLANNHILDHGYEGLKTTIELLKENNIQFLGAGDNIFQAARPHIIRKNNLNIGVYACAEHEFSIATTDNPGANPFDPLESLDHIKKLKEKTDYVIVLYHGGKEHYRYPSPYLQKACRKMVEKGADLVICQHSHCVGAFENYLDSTIVYGQGNFIFNKHDNEYWNNSILIQIDLENNFKIEFVPIVTNEIGIELAAGDVGNKILNGFYSRSKEILRPGFVEKKYREYASQNLPKYLRHFSGFGKWVSRIDRRILNGWLLNKIYNKNKLTFIRNYTECEAHRELLIEGIKNKKG